MSLENYRNCLKLNMGYRSWVKLHLEPVCCFLELKEEKEVKSKEYYKSLKAAYNEYFMKEVQAKEEGLMNKIDCQI